MSIKINSDKHYQKVKDVYEVKLEVDLKTRNCESMSNCSLEGPCEFYKFHEFSVFLNDKKIFGELWFHVTHDDKETLEYGITLYEIESFSLDIELKFEMIGKDEKEVQRLFDMFSKDAGKVSEVTSNSVNKKLSQDALYCNYEGFVIFANGIDSNSKFLVTGEFNLKFDLDAAILQNKNQMVANFKSLLCENALESFESKKNFTIICQGNEFHFN